MPVRIDAREVGSVDELISGGDYFVKRNDAGIEALWFAMPGFPESRWNRIPGPTDRTSKNRWDINVTPEGRIHVEPSILSWWKWQGEDRRFHAFLHNGVWEVLDDTVGAVFK